MFERFPPNPHLKMVLSFGFPPLLAPLTGATCESGGAQPQRSLVAPKLVAKAGSGGEVLIRKIKGGK
jgi:hypothetical protein